MAYTSPAMARVIKARAKLIISQPFYGSLALRLDVVEDARVETCATNGRQFFFAPEFVLKCSEAEMIAVWVHELLHCAYLHFARRNNRDLGEWNVATDHVINNDVKADGFKLPTFIELYCDPRFAGWSAEQVHAELYGKRVDPKPEPKPEKSSQDDSGDDNTGQEPGSDGSESEGGSGDGAEGEGEGEDTEGSAEGGGSGGSGGGQGSDSGKPGNASGKPSQGQGEGTQGEGNGAERKPGSAPQATGGLGGVLDASLDDPTSKAELDDLVQEWREAVSQAAGIAKAQGIGKCPANMKSIVKAATETAVDPREHILRFINDATITDLDWSRSSRRNPDPTFIMPGKRPNAIQKIVAAIDTSGSINEAIFSAFKGYCRELLDLDLISELVVVQTDTRVTRVDEFTRGDEIEFELFGRGGTNFDAVMTWIADEHSDAKAVLFLTDMLASSFGNDPGMPVLWLSWSSEATLAVYSYSIRLPEFGEIVFIDPAAL